MNSANLENKNIFQIASEIQQRSVDLDAMLKAREMRPYLDFALQFNRDLASASLACKWEEQDGID